MPDYAQVDSLADFARMGGDSADKLINNNFHPGVLRPWIGRDGRSYVNRMVHNAKTGLWEPRVFISNTPATLTYDAWKIFDEAVIRAVRDRLVAFADLRARGLVYNIPNGMAHTVLQYQTVGDITRATISMDPARRSEGDRPIVDIGLLPLPVIHKDFDFSAREIMVSRNGNIPLPIDTTTGELAARKVAEEVERMTVGTTGVTPFSYGGGTIYGYTNFPQRITSTTMTVPTGPATNAATINELLSLRQSLINAKHYGPYALYFSGNWAQYLDQDFQTAKGDNTLRQRILSIQGFEDVQILDYLDQTKFNVIMVDMKAENARAVVGMEVQTVQWDSLGGWMKHFKVMCILVVQLRPDTNGLSGIAHGRTP